MTLDVNLGERSYPIHIGTELLNNAELVESLVIDRQVLIITNDTIAPLYLRATEKLLSSAGTLSSLILPDGEAFKNLTTLNQVFDRLLTLGYSRNCILVALGGGVIGDMTGYAAASYQRGVDFIQIPTTLLAQVDSSVGGKTGVNHPLGKNMIGAFHQPRLVLADMNSLKTLPDREYAAGLAEVVKYGILGDSEFFSWLEVNAEKLLARDPVLLAQAVERCCQNKATIVAEDEKESGKRALLNLGHTFGHAIEAHMGYGRWLHGEAVSAGMVMAVDLAQRLGWLTEQDVSRVRQLLLVMQLPVEGPAEMAVDDYLPRMAVDKKNLDGRLRLILPRSIGCCEMVSTVDHQLLCETLRSCSATR
ncbi:3-dehydroquinate synthase [Pelagibaculum spongiae]|uniref:3-dehydroquinate synthase n=1 Tax=Pelagibaculum spongiae TaxID=2080658 RepID=A0A2V1GWF5_9GAMM|nr:3-dehydroquinate synthase [Pelagibaculum spongiae]PVZ68278.1 3-dehydroquinate synthase [Pelagibaculum spongiae]